MCKILGVSRSGYDVWKARQDRPESVKEAFDRELKKKIAKSFHESYATYGSPRVYMDLKEWGYSVSLSKVARMMREMGLSAIPEKKYIVTTDSDHSHQVFPNLLKRDFTASAPDQVWVADITYIWTIEGWLYLASIMDLFSRKIIGMSIDTHMKKDLTVAALNMAMETRLVSDGLIHHSDRGAQYCANDYVSILEQQGCQISMSRKGDPYDNACIESFHATIKKEMIYRRRFQTRAEGRKAISSYISRYNTHRRHSTLGYISPIKFEQHYLFAGMKYSA